VEIRSWKMEKRHWGRELENRNWEVVGFAAAVDAVARSDGEEEG
jgi:hypothetical protein